MTIRKRGKRYHYDFTLPGYPRMRGVIPEARTKWEAEQAEIKLKRELFEDRYELAKMGTARLGDFIDQYYLPWSRANKRSWKDDEYIAPVLKSYFRGKTLREVSPQLVERFKSDRLNTTTKYNRQDGESAEKRPRAPATVNRELSLLSSVFSLAITYKKATVNPCSEVNLFKLDNQQDRYLLPEEEPRLLAALTGPREHLRELVIVALGTGMRQGEQLRMQRRQVDFFRNMVTARKTKNGKDRDIPMNSDVRAALAKLCEGKGPNDYVFASRKTGGHLTEIKRSFTTALEIAGIQGFTWRDLRATFGTRLAAGGADAFTIAQLMGHSDVRITMRYVRMVERSKRTAVESASLDFHLARHNGVTNEKQPPRRTAVSS